METQDFLTKAEEQNLKTKGLTGSGTGYPEPDLGYVAYGFNDFNEAERFAEETGGETIHITFRDGWSYATDRGRAVIPPKTPQSDWFGDGYHVIDSPFKDFTDFIGFKSKAQAVDEMGPEWVVEALKAYDEARADLDACVDFDNGEVALFEELNFVQALHPMYYDHDTRHYAVGVAHYFEDVEEEEENNE